MNPWLMKLCWYAFVVLVVFGLGYGLSYQTTYPKMVKKDSEITSLNTSLKTLGEQRKADQATLALLRKNNAATARETAALRLSLSAALAKNRKWADQTVPQEVQDAL